jgi:hypothetical protein
VDDGEEVGEGFARAGLGSSWILLVLEDMVPEEDRRTQDILSAQRKRNSLCLNSSRLCELLFCDSLQKAGIQVQAGEGRLRGCHGLLLASLSCNGFGNIV